MTAPGNTKIRLDASGLRLGDELVPLHSAAIDYFSMSRSAWRPALEAIARLGARLVDVTVPWSVHEIDAGRFDFGSRDPRLDVGHFLDLAHELGLHALVRVGPVVDAGVPRGGVPERVVWDPDCQARSAGGEPVVLPTLPVSFPEPSLASAAFHREARVWLAAVGAELAPRVWPLGAVALVHAGGVLPPARGGSLAPDHHPDAVGQYRRFLRQKYRTPVALRRAHRAPDATFDDATPPPTLTAGEDDALAARLDFLELAEAANEASLYRQRVALRAAGLGDVPLVQGLSPRAERGPWDPARLGRVADAVTLELDDGCDWDATAKAAAALDLRAAARGTPALVSRAPAGFAAFAAGRPAEEDSFTSMVALAYGARGLSLRLGAARPGWIGSPHGERGEPRPAAVEHAEVFRVARALDIHRLSRRIPVRIVVPRSVTRLRAACAAGHPLLEALPLGAASLPADEWAHAPTRGALAELRAFLAALEEALDDAGVAHATVSEEALGPALEEAAWTIVACPGALDPSLVQRLSDRILGGAAVSVGPRSVDRDALFNPVDGHLPRLEHPTVPVVLPRGPATLRALVETTLDDLGVERLAVAPRTVRATLHRDADQAPRALFAVNPSAEPADAILTIPGTNSATDVVTGERLPAGSGTLALRIPPRTVRALALEPSP